MRTNSCRSALTDDADHLELCGDEIIDIPLLLLDNLDYENSPPGNQCIYTDWSKCCIYRVPRKLRSVNEAAYTPQIVSIGPFHHGHPNLRAMETLKSRYLDEFCKRTGKSYHDLESIIDKVCESIRACYAGTFELTRKGFVEMLITDSGFIIELLLRSFESNEDDYILNKPWLRNCIEHDLILLENQLPFFALDKMFNFAKPAIKKDHGTTNNKDDATVFLTLTCKYFLKHYHLKHFENDVSHLKHSENDVSHLKHSENDVSQLKHFTDLLRSYFCNSKLYGGKKCIESLRNATKLEEAGVDFKAEETTYLNTISFQKRKFLRHCPCCNCAWLHNCLPCFFQISPCLKCEQPTLKLPRFEVDDTTECVFRNLMALEQCHYPNEAYICNYVSLMDKLINTMEDVELLIDKKVIVNKLGSSKQVAELLNKLCQHIVEQNSCFYECVQEINRHRTNHLNRIMGTLTSVYFKDFWRGTATVVGLIVLGLTVWNMLLRPILTKGGTDEVPRRGHGPP